MAEAGVVVERSPRAYPRDAMLTIDEVAEWMQISVSQVGRLNLPAVPVGKRRWRYLFGQVVDALQRRAE